MNNSNFEVAISWDKDTIKRDKELGRNEKSLYPDSVIWSMAINRVGNPTIKLLLDEISNKFKNMENEISELKNEIEVMKNNTILNKIKDFFKISFGKEFFINGYKIKYNSFYHGWNVSHDKIGFIGMFDIKKDAIEHAEKG